MTDRTSISPAPTDEEAVAITAAIEAMWPRPMIAAETQNPLRSPTWRFSGRWWSVPAIARRNRPYK